jgi:hypothetical protein
MFFDPFKLSHLKTRDMKTTKTLVIVILIILAIPLLGYAAWMIKKETQLEIFVVNKSMKSFRGSENKAFNYILNKEKVFTAGNRNYNLEVDHYGLMWNRDDYRIKFPRLEEVERAAEKADLVYYADVSGIQPSGPNEKNRDQIAYKGLNNTDYTFIREVISRGKPLVFEFCFLSPPTEPLVRFNLEKLTDVYYVGWVGKYVRDLNADPDPDELCNWKALYREYTGNQWSAKGPGVIMINPENERVLVLQEGKEIDCSDGLIFSTKDAIAEYNLPSRVNYHGWFSVLHAGRNIILSEFNLNATDEGRKMLNEFGIPEIFPALIHADDNLYFMAGDFGKCRSNPFFSRVMGVGSFIDGARSRSMRASNFFYAYYKPFMTRMVQDAKELKRSDNLKES